MEVKAVQKYLVTSPKKLRGVAALVKNLKPTEALEYVPFLKKRSSEALGKVIKVAVANAKQKGADEESLVFKEIQINEGPRLKRWKAGARGRAKPYRRRMSHIRVVLTTVDAGKKPSGKEKTKTKSEKSEKRVKNRKFNQKIKTRKNNL